MDVTPFWLVMGSAILVYSVSAHLRLLRQRKAKRSRDIKVRM